MAPKKIGRYHIEDLLGQGSMGVVFKAYDPVLERYAAIKVMNTGVDVDDELRARFFREARSAAKLNHPNIISIYDLGENRKRPFIAMEYVEGEDLRAIIKKRAFIPFSEKLRFVSQICEGLDYAHRKGVTHRDIKPGNVFITQYGGLKILDFGLARLASSEMTRSGMLLGSPYYMSPEQVKGSPDIDGRSDLFSIGVLLYELISYTRPFEGETPTSVCFQIVSEPHHPISLVLPGCAPQLEHIIDRALCKDREKRYQSGSELTADLLELQEQLPKAQETLRKGIKPLQAELKKYRKDFKNPLIQDLVDDEFFEPREVDPETKVSLLGSEIDPDDYGSLLLRQADLKRRLEIVVDRQSKAQQILKLFKTAQAQLKEGQQEACRTTLEKIFKLNPKSAEALRVQETLEKRRREQETQLQLEAALAVARSALDQEDFERCLQVVSTAFEIAPTHAEALDLRDKAREGIELRKLEDLLATVRQYERSQDHEGCYKAATEALELDPKHTELQEIQRRAEKAMKKEHQVESLLKKARQRLKSKQFNRALKFAEKVLAFQPEQPEALELKRKALEVIDPEHPDLKNLHELAATQTSAQREHLSQIAKVLDFAQSEIKRGNLKAALHNLSFLLELEPDHPTALRLKEHTEAELSRKQAKAEAPSEVEKDVSPISEANHVLKDVTLTIRQKCGRIGLPRVPLKISAILAKPWLAPLAGVAFMLLLVLAVVIAWAGGDPSERILDPSAESPSGSMILNVAPWANVDSIIRLDNDQAISIDQDLSTPCVVHMPPGKYRVRVSNPHFNGPLEFEVSIVAGESSVVHKKLPNFDLEEAFSAVVENQSGL
ncbi:MAG: protein kinase [Acidobacteria bacterium]|nr:protein kinase [Acidobacteriota bacterium]